MKVTMMRSPNTCAKASRLARKTSDTTTHVKQYPSAETFTVWLVTCLRETLSSFCCARTSSRAPSKMAELWLHIFFLNWLVWTNHWVTCKCSQHLFAVCSSWVNKPKSIKAICTSRNLHLYFFFTFNSCTYNGLNDAFTIINDNHVPTNVCK